MIRLRHFLRAASLLLLSILGLGLCIRLYKIREYVQFLGDEGRDALVVKRILVDHVLTLLGPTASVAGFYVGGLYYYFMLPFMYLWNLDPVGPAYMSVCFGFGSIVLIYLLCKENFGQKIALIIVLLAIFSPRLTYISRFSWNPNPSIFFSLLTIFLLYKGLHKHAALYIFLSSVSVGILLELHYINLIFVPLLFILILVGFPIKKFLYHICLAVLGICLGNAMFILYELRHDLQNSKAVWEFITRKSVNVAPRSLNLIWLFNDIQRRNFEIIFGFRGWFLNLFYILSLLTFTFFCFQKWQNRLLRNKRIFIFLWLLIGTLGVGFYRGQLYDHYFGLIYALPLFLVGSLLYFLSRNINSLFVAAIIIYSIIFFEVQNLYWWQPPNNQVKQTEKAAKIVYDLASGEPYNFALLAKGNSDYAYRFFLEKWKSVPVVIKSPQEDPQRISVTKQLIVLCENEIECHPLGNPLWEVAGFGRAEIIKTVSGDGGIVVHKLIHYTSQ